MANVSPSDCQTELTLYALMLRALPVYLVEQDIPPESPRMKIHSDRRFLALPMLFAVSLMQGPPVIGPSYPNVRRCCRQL